MAANNNSFFKEESVLNNFLQHNRAGSLEKERDVIVGMKQQEAEQILGLNLEDFDYKAVHLWRYAAPVNAAPQP